jgi:hypothetical protein
MKMNRREFLKLSTCAAAAVEVGCVSGGAMTAEAPLPKLGDIRALLLHLGHNMWCDWFPPDVDTTGINNLPDTALRNKDDLWLKTTNYAAKKGVNMIVIDVGEGVVYPSHPELAIKGSWSPDKLRAEVRRLRAMGVEAIPKLNFSTSHNGWLKQYRRMISTPTYYKVCEDVLRDVHEIFDRPRFIHIGCDEEQASHQINIVKYLYIVARTQEFWMHDYLHLVRTVENLGARPWCWSDYGWRHPEFLKRSPKSVVMSNWYYDEMYGGFDPKTNKTSDLERLVQFWDLEKAGFDQIPCGTNWPGEGRRNLKIGADDVMGKLVKKCREVIAPERLLGFLMAPWECLKDEEAYAINISAIDIFDEALRQGN